MAAGLTGKNWSVKPYDIVLTSCETATTEVSAETPPPTAFRTRQTLS